MSLESYTDPVAQLLTYGQKNLELGQEWVDYPAQFGFTDAHVPDLIRLITDPQFNDIKLESDAVWAPVHAVRALGQLRAEAAIAPLLSLLSEDDDYFQTDIPYVLGKIGEAAIAPIVAFVNDGESDDVGQGLAIHGLGLVGEEHPESREAAIAALLGIMENPPDDPESLQLTYAIGELIDLEATEAIPQIEQAFAAGKIDESVVGNWPMVQVAMGLKEESDFAPEELQLKPDPALLSLGATIERMEREETPSQGFGQFNVPTKKKKKKKKK